MTTELGPVVIGPREIYDQVVRVAGAVDRVGAQLEDLGHDVRDHESRIRSLERGRWPLPALSTLVAIAALALTIFNR